MWIIYVVLGIILLAIIAWSRGTILIIIGIVILVWYWGDIKRFTLATFSLGKQTEVYQKTVKPALEKIEMEAVKIDSLQKIIDDSLRIERRKRLGLK